jgi:hypothetical protein
MVGKRKLPTHLPILAANADNSLSRSSRINHSPRVSEHVGQISKCRNSALSLAPIAARVNNFETHIDGIY